jgi:hypothetical protein
MYCCLYTRCDSLHPRGLLPLVVCIFSRFFAAFTRCGAALHRRPTELSEKSPRRTVSPKQLPCGARRNAVNQSSWFSKPPPSRTLDVMVFIIALS